jgi:hypothetical protein
LTHNVLIALGLCFSGCSEKPEAPAAPAAVDPRFATAAALLAHYNSITTREPVDIVAAYDLCYAENDFQRRYIDASRRMLPFCELDRLMFEKFGECFDPKRKAHLLAPDQPASMTRDAEQRAEAKFIDSEGDPETLHLVRVGDRWWVCGFTFEYEPQMEEYKQNMDGLERLTDALVAAAPTVIEGIKSGQITSAKKARDSLKATMRNVTERN